MKICREIPKLSDTLREDLNKFYCCRRQSVATKALLAAKGGGEGEDRSVRHVSHNVGYVTTANTALCEVRTESYTTDSRSS